MKIMIHYQYKFLGVISILYNLRRKNAFNLGIFFFWREIKISFKIFSSVAAVMSFFPLF